MEAFNVVVSEFKTQFNSIFPELVNETMNWTEPSTFYYCCNHSGQFYSSIVNMDTHVSKQETYYLPNVCFFDIWTDDKTSFDTKKNIWSYLQSIYKVCTTCIDPEVPNLPISDEEEEEEKEEEEEEEEEEETDVMKAFMEKIQSSKLGRISMETAEAAAAAHKNNQSLSFKDMMEFAQSSGLIEKVSSLQPEEVLSDFSSLMQCINSESFKKQKQTDDGTSSFFPDTKEITSLLKEGGLASLLKEGEGGLASLLKEGGGEGGLASLLKEGEGGLASLFKEGEGGLASLFKEGEGEGGLASLLKEGEGIQNMLKGEGGLAKLVESLTKVVQNATKPKVASSSAKLAQSLMKKKTHVVTDEDRAVLAEKIRMRVLEKKVANDKCSDTELVKMYTMLQKLG